MLRRFQIDRSLDANTASLVDAALRAAGSEPATDGADLVWTAVPTRTVAAGARVSALPGLDALLLRRSLSDLHARATALLHTCSPDVAPLAYPLTLALPDERAAFALAAAYAPDAGWIRRPRVHDTNLRPEPILTGHERAGDTRWDAQRLVTSPHLMDGHAYSLRFAAIVDSVVPLRAALWHEPRVMRATLPYDARATGAAFLGACITPEAAEGLDWQAALRADGLNPEAVRRAAEHTLAALFASAVTSMREAGDAFGGTPGHGFALLEFDVLVDRAGDAHLLECAAWPHVKPGRAVGAHLLDAWSVTLMQGVLARLDGADEVPGFVPLFPSPRPERLALLAEPHPADVAAARAVAARTDTVFVPQRVSHLFLDDAVVLFAELTGRVSVLNPSASYAWMRLAEGIGLDTTIDEMAELFRAPRDVVAQDVWTAVAEWTRAGLIGGRPPAPLPVPDAQPVRAWGWNTSERVYQHLGWPVLVRCPGDEDEGWLSSTLLAHASDAREARSTIEVLREGDTYALLVDGSTRVGPLAPRDTPAAVHTWIRRLALAGRQGVLGLTARLVHTERDAAKAILLVQAGRSPDAAVPGVGTRIQFEERPLAVRREGAPHDAVAIAAIVRIEWTPGPAALAPLRRADALQALLSDDPNTLTAFDAEGVGALVGFMLERPCYTLTAATADDARAALDAMLASL